MATEEPMEGLLGDLEADVMDVVWARGAVTVRDVHAALQPDRPLAYTTVMTVMSRLADKGVLTRQKQGRPFVYRPAEGNRGGFLRQQARTRIRGLLDQFGSVAVAEFLDELTDGDTERLQQLERLLAQPPQGEVPS